MNITNTNRRNIMDRPLVLLDIDGVVNAFDAPYEAIARGGYTQTQGGGYRLTIRPEWAEWVDGLAEHGDVVWATMWQRFAITDFAPATGIGLGIADYIDFDRHHRSDLGRRTGSGVGGYKQPGVEAYVGDRPFVWIDDDIRPEQVVWAMERNLAGIPTLLLVPDPAVGLTADDVRMVQAFREIVERAEDSLTRELATMMEDSLL
jgi:hypothetical protein